MSSAQRTSHSPIVRMASCMAENQSSCSASFEMGQTHASREWPFLAQSGRSPQAWVITFAYWALHRFAAADPGPVIRRALLAIWAVKSSILERNSLRIGDLFALL